MFICPLTHCKMGEGGIYLYTYRRGLTGVAYPSDWQCESHKGGMSGETDSHAFFIFSRIGGIYQAVVGRLYCPNGGYEENIYLFDSRFLAEWNDQCPISQGTP